MIRKHVFIRSDHNALIKRDMEAREGVTLSDIIRRALDQYYELDQKPKSRKCKQGGSK